MTQKEKFKEAVIKAAIDGQLSAVVAGKRLGVSDRQVRKLKVKMRTGVCLKHGNCRASPKRRKDEDRELIVQHYKDERFSGANFAHFRELLEEHFGIKIAYKQLRQILNEAGFKSPKKQKKRKTHRSRTPRERFGEMLQTDGSPHQWFAAFGDNAFYSLHGFLDDATGIPTGLFFCKNECLDGYFESFRQTLENYGVPGSIYADGLNVFFSKENQPELLEMLDGIYEPKTQFAKIADSLGVDLIRAGSPQAKGKIERLWQTLQSRLTIEFKIHGIDNMEKANKFLTKFMIDFKKKFAKTPTSDKSDFLPLPKGINLDILLTKRVTRKVDAGLVFSLHNNKFRVDGVPPKATIEVVMSTRLGFKVLYKEKLYKVTPFVATERIEDMLHYHLYKNEKLQYGDMNIRKNDVVQTAL
jgi:transposase